MASPANVPQPQAPSPALTFVAGFVLALVLFGASGLLFMGTRMGDGSMMGPGMMGGGTGAAAGVVVLAALGLIALYLAFRGRSSTGRAQPAGAAVSPASLPPVAAASAPAGPAPSVGGPGTPTGITGAEAEALTLRLLDADERLLFIEVKEKGGVALQKDLGHRDGFSRTKVTRVLDRLESKGLVVREREGMTNRVRLLMRGDMGT